MIHGAEAPSVQHDFRMWWLRHKKVSHLKQTYMMPVSVPPPRSEAPRRRRPRPVGIMVSSLESRQSAAESSAAAGPKTLEMAVSKGSLCPQLSDIAAAALDDAESTEVGSQVAYRQTGQRVEITEEIAKARPVAAIGLDVVRGGAGVPSAGAVVLDMLSDAAVKKEIVNPPSSAATGWNCHVDVDGEQTLSLEQIQLEAPMETSYLGETLAKKMQQAKKDMQQANMMLRTCLFKAAAERCRCISVSGSDHGTVDAAKVSDSLVVADAVSGDQVQAPGIPSSNCIVTTGPRQRQATTGTTPRMNGIEALKKGLKSGEVSRIIDTVEADAVQCSQPVADASPKSMIASSAGRFSPHNSRDGGASKRDIMVGEAVQSAEDSDHTSMPTHLCHRVPSTVCGTVSSTTDPRSTNDVELWHSLWTLDELVSAVNASIAIVTVRAISNAVQIGCQIDESLHVSGTAAHAPHDADSCTGNKSPAPQKLPL